MQSIIDEIIIDDEQQEEPKQQQYSPINNEASISPEVQRFFAFSKRVPKSKWNFVKKKIKPLKNIFYSLTNFYYYSNGNFYYFLF